MSRNLTFVSRTLTKDRVQKPDKCEISYIYRRCGSRLRVQQPDKCESSYKRHRFSHFIVQSVGATTRKVWMVLQTLSVCSFTSEQCGCNNQKSQLFMPNAYMFVYYGSIIQLPRGCKNQRYYFTPYNSRLHAHARYAKIVGLLRMSSGLTDLVYYTKSVKFDLIL